MTDSDVLPETPSQIDAQWLSGALDAEIESLSTQPLGEGVGFMGDVLKLDIESPDPSVPRHLVAKLPKLENRVVGELLGVYEREILFFRAFGGELPVRGPRLVFSEFDRDVGSENQKPIIRALDRLPGFLNGAIGWLAMRAAAAKNRRYLLLLEFYENMQAGDQLRGLDAEACAKVLCAIAPLHRHYWADQALKEHFWLMELDIDARMRQGTLRRHARAYRSLLSPEIATHIDWLCRHTAELVRRFCADAPATLLHGDLRLDNVVFGREECAFLDFQMVRSGPAAYDVAYFISGALEENATAEDRLQVLIAYHQALAIPGYRFGCLQRDVDRGLMMVLSALSGNADVQLGEGRGDAMMTAWYRRLAAAVRHIDPHSLLAD